MIIELKRMGKSQVLKPLFTIIANFYYSLRLSKKTKFRKIFFVKSSKILMYDRDIRRKFVFFLSPPSRKMIDYMFCNYNYLMYRDKISNIINKKFPRGKFLILDLGANFGTFGIYYYYLQSFHSESKPYLYLFEPLPYNIELLKKNLRSNDIKGYEFFPNAVCEKSGDYVDLFVGDTYTGCTIMKAVGDGYRGNKIKVRTLSIDSLGLKNVGLVKLNIEGAEELALKGMKKTITINTPIIICKYEHRTNDRDFIIKCVRSCGDYEYKDDKINKLLYFLPRKN